MLIFKENPHAGLTVRTFSNGLVSFEDSRGLTIICPPCPMEHLHTSPSRLSVDDQSWAGSDDARVSDYNVDRDTEEDHLSTGSWEREDGDEASFYQPISLESVCESSSSHDTLDELEAWYEDACAEPRPQPMPDFKALACEDNRRQWAMYWSAARRGRPGHEEYLLPILSESGLKEWNPEALEALSSSCAIEKWNEDVLAQTQEMQELVQLQREHNREQWTMYWLAAIHGQPGHQEYNVEDLSIA